MKRNLEELLREMDAETQTSKPIPNLGNRVRKLSLRKRRIRQGIAVCGLAIISFAAISTFISKLQQNPGPLALHQTHTESAVKAEDIADIDLRAELHSKTADLLLEHQGARRARKALLFNTVLPTPQEQRDRAALILIYDADRYARVNRPADAVAAYRRTIALFPQSHWADVARDRLKEHQTQERGQS